MEPRAAAREPGRSRLEAGQAWGGSWAAALAKSADPGTAARVPGSCVSVISRVMKRWFSDTRSISTAIVSTACSIRSRRSLPTPTLLVVPPADSRSQLRLARRTAVGTAISIVAANTATLIKNISGPARLRGRGLIGGRNGTSVVRVELRQRPVHGSEAGADSFPVRAARTLIVPREARAAIHESLSLILQLRLPCLELSIVEPIQRVSRR